jgi:hypothetical protein
MYDLCTADREPGAGRYPPRSVGAPRRRPDAAEELNYLRTKQEGASRVLKHNEVVSSTIPPGISSRSQSDQSLNFGFAGPRCRGRDEANSGCVDTYRDPGTRDWDLCPLGHGEPPSRLSPARAARNEAPPAKRQPCGRSRGNE